MVRKTLRELVQFIERRKRSTVITDFVDEITDGLLIDLPGTAVGVDPERLREKALAFLRKYADAPVIHKLKFNEALSSDDLVALEEIFFAEGTTREEIEAAKMESEGLGLFVRSIVGLDRQAAKAALSRFLNDKQLTANQIEFTNLVINHLAAQGWMETVKLYTSPFTDIHPHGVEGLFDEQTIVSLVSTLQEVRRNAAVPAAG